MSQDEKGHDMLSTDFEDSHTVGYIKYITACNKRCFTKQ